MKALILAAGRGSRLRPITDARPKAMVEVQGTPVVFKQIANLVENGVTDIVVVVGYKADFIVQELKREYPFVKVIVNNEYDRTNNMYSAYLAARAVYEEPFLLMNADVFFDSAVITELLRNEFENAIVVDKGAFNPESMKVKSRFGKITEISKQIIKEDAFGVSIDVYRVSSKGSRILFDKIADYIENRGELNHWTEVAINDILADVDFVPCLLRGRWVEIDTYEDLMIANRVFSNSQT